MIGIALRFPAGRFHATSWGRHVNEGVPEWPPSPWRLLRSLVATWKTKAAEIDAGKLREVFNQLLDPPVFSLPAATSGHTRHYMPWDKNWKKLREGATTLVFDAFVCLDRESSVTVIWPDTELDDNQRQILSKLLRRLGYLGRAESWCEAELLPDKVAREHFMNANCRPLNGEPPGDREEIVRVLNPDPDSALADEHVQLKKGGRKSKRPIYDPAWHLCIETSQLHSEKWSDPPGSCWVPYLRRTDCFDPPPKPRKRPQKSERRAQVVRFALDSSVLPLVTETLPVAEAARRALMSLYNAGETKSEVFSGKDVDGKRLSGHRHAYFLPTDEDGDGRLDHLTVYAAGGFSDGEMRALDRLRTVKRRGDEAAHPLRVLLLGMGLIEEGYRPGPLGTSHVWESATPYVAARYAKTRGKNRIDLRSIDAVIEFLIEDLRRQIGEVIPQAENPAAITVEPLLEGSAFKVSGRRPIQFKRFRQKPNDDGGQRLAGTFRIEFPHRVTGPIALGHSSHFGMGLFMPVTT